MQWHSTASDRQQDTAISYYRSRWLFCGLRFEL
jgi:hypothetical protein